MLTRPRKFTDRDKLDELVQIEPDAEFLEHRTRDLGLPDIVWWSTAAIAGPVAMAAIVSLLVPLNEDVAWTIGFGAMGALWAFAWRRWGHRRFRFRVAAADGLWFGLLASGAFLLRILTERLLALTP